MIFKRKKIWFTEIIYYYFCNFHRIIKKYRKYIQKTSLKKKILLHDRIDVYLISIHGNNYVELIYIYIICCVESVVYVENISLIYVLFIMRKKHSWKMICRIVFIIFTFWQHGFNKIELLSFRNSEKNANKMKSSQRRFR